MPIARIRNVDAPIGRISGFVVAETSRSRLARGSAIGILLAITRGITQSSAPPSSTDRPYARIRNTE